MSDAVFRNLNDQRREAQEWLRRNGRKLPSAFAGRAPSPDTMLRQQSACRQKPESLEHVVNRQAAQREKVEAVVATADAAVVARRERQRGKHPGRSTAGSRRRPGRRERAGES